MSVIQRPAVGIWWDNGQQIVAYPRLPDNVHEEVGFCDSDDTHNDLWPDAAKQFGLACDEEYFSVPRGRVLWSPSKKTSIIYHGNATGPDRLRKIAAEFSLSKWQACIDLHYMFGEDINELFED